MSTTIVPLRRQQLSQEANQLLAVCRSFKTGSFKRAAAVGDSEATFEQAMSNLAHATVRDRAPGLMDYELGFQLVEKSEDNDRAVGVFAFKVGPQMMYVPVFFLNGQIKGHELLYLKESDTFVPLEEGWVTYLLSRKPILVGEGISPSDTFRGSRTPDLSPFRQSPATKTGAARDWEADACVVLGYLSDAARLPKQPLRLPQLIKSSSAHAVSFCKMLNAYPTLLRPFAECYGADFIKAAAARADEHYSAFRDDAPTQRPTVITGSAFVEKPQSKAASFDPTYGGRLQIYHYDGEPKPELTAEEQLRLKLDRTLIKDAREKHSAVFQGTELQPMSLNNPSETGVYDVLVKPGEFERCFVAIASRQGYGLPPTVVVKLGDSKKYLLTTSNKVLTGDQDSRADYEKWWNDLPAADSLDKDSDYLLVGPGGQTLGPLAVSASAPSTEGESCYKVWWLRGDFRPGGRSYQPHRRGEESYRNPDDNGETDTVSIGLVAGHKLVERPGVYYVPKSWKALKLAKPSADSRDREDFRCGDMADITLGIMTKTAELKVWTDGIEAEIGGRRMTKAAARVHLVRDHGINANVATNMLKIAERRGGNRFRVKYADYYGSPFDQYGGGYSMPPWPDDSPQSGSFMNDQVPTQVSREWNLPIESNFPTDDRRISDPPMPDPDAMNSVQRAVQLGQREVLDTSAFTSLLNTTRSDSGIDQYLSAVMEGLDAQGRLLFNYYWHNDMFGERYGDSDLSELEDLLRSAFEASGKLLLKLRQETVAPFPGESFEMGIGEFQ